MRIYISGKMRNVPLYNFPAFDAAAEVIRRDGNKAINPADLDREMGFHPEELPDDWDWSSFPPGTDVSEFVDRDLDALATCDAIYMLPGWEQSKGATAEHAVAQWRGLTIFYPETKDKVAERKATPLYRGLLMYFPDACQAVARLSYVANEQHNPGEDMHWAREKSTDHPDCLMRHLVDAGTLDDDGQRHSAKVAWRAMALLQTEIERERQ